MQKYTGKIVESKHITKRVKYVKIEHVEPKEMSFFAGQYFTVLLGKGVLRAYSIATDQTETGFIESYIDITPGGPGSIFFENSRPGDEIKYVGPSGHFNFENNEWPDVFISTGTGVVPFLSMIKSGVRESTYPIYLLQGFRYCDDAFLKEELDILDKSENFDYQFTFSKDSQENCFTGRVTDHLEELIEKFGTKIDAYICGGREMVIDVEKGLLELGVAPENIKYEKYN
jgi:ferredoxin-NADP reductase